MKRAHVVIGLGFGDEGKGVVTDHLVRSTGAGLVVRFNGGHQAAHNVMTPEGLHHTFSQFGSGTLAGASTFLSRFMLIEPLALRAERDVLRSKGIDPQLWVDPGCVIITPYHRAANRLREAARGSARHGSVGLGVGEARSDALNGLRLSAEDLWWARFGSDRSKLVHDLLHAIQLAKIREFGARDDLRDDPGSVAQELIEAFSDTEVAEFWRIAKRYEGAVFEGAQGALLDERYGFAPYNTWTDCTFTNADTLLNEVGCVERQRIGVLRSYATRHGAGPFVTEDERLAPLVPEVHNGTHPWMGPMRVGHFDLVAARYACEATQPDVLAVTHLDRRPSEVVAVRYSPELRQGEDCAARLFATVATYERIDNLLGALEHSMGVPVAYGFRGPSSGDAIAFAAEVAA